MRTDFRIIREEMKHLLERSLRPAPDPRPGQGPAGGQLHQRGDFVAKILSPMGLSPVVGTAITAAPRRAAAAVTAIRAFFKFTAGLLRTATGCCSLWFPASDLETTLPGAP